MNLRINGPQRRIRDEVSRHVCTICNWPQARRQKLHDDLLVGPDEIQPLTVLSDRHSVRPQILTSHVGICMGRSALAHAVSSKDTIFIRDISRAMIEGVNRSLQKAEQLLADEEAENPDTGRVGLAKAQIDLIKARTAVIASIGQVQRDSEARDRLVLMEGAITHQRRSLQQVNDTGTKLITGGKQQKSLAELLKRPASASIPDDPLS